MAETWTWDLAGMRAQIIDNWRVMHPDEPNVIIVIKRYNPGQYGHPRYSASLVTSDEKNGNKIQVPFRPEEQQASTLNYAVWQLLDQTCKLVHETDIEKVEMKQSKEETESETEEWDMT